MAGISNTLLGAPHRPGLPFGGCLLPEVQAHVERLGFRKRINGTSANGSTERPATCRVSRKAVAAVRSAMRKGERRA